MEEYNPIDYKVTRPNQNKGKVEETKPFDFKINKWNIVFIAIIIIQFIVLYNVNDRLSLVEGAFQKQLDKYQLKLEKNEAAIRKLEESQKNKTNK